jgi:hypothetical protein
LKGDGFSRPDSSPPSDQGNDSLANHSAHSTKETSYGPPEGAPLQSKQNIESNQRGKKTETGGSIRVTQTDADVFRAFVAAGRRLAEIHVNYEQQPEYPLTKTEKPGEKLDWRVNKMRLSKDKTTLVYNNLITLSGIPPESYEYRLGNRSALEWVIDQYQVSTDNAFRYHQRPEPHG